MLVPRTDIYLVQIDDDLVALDIRQDAYFCLPGLGLHLEPDATGGWVPTDPTIADALINTGLFQNGSPSCPPLSLTPLARTSRHVGSFPSNWRAPTDGLLTWVREARRIHGRPIKTLIGQSPSLPIRLNVEEEILRDTHLFERLIPWAPHQGQCLYRAYLLKAFLAARGHGVVWVFGVRTWPFGAHCWLQIGDLLLDDDLDRVSLYNPILAVGA